MLDISVVYTKVILKMFTSGSMQQTFETNLTCYLEYEDEIKHISFVKLIKFIRFRPY